MFICEGLKIAVLSTRYLSFVDVLAKGGNERAVRHQKVLCADNAAVCCPGAALSDDQVVRYLTWEV